MPRPPNAELPRLLLDAALGLLDERQSIDFSMRELARRVGYTVTAVYRCYETRGHLLRTLSLKLFGLLAQELAAPVEGDGVEERVAAIGERYLEWAIRHPGRYKLMFQLEDEDSALGPDEQEVARAGLQILVDVLLDDGPDGVDPAEARALGIAIFGYLHGMASLAIAGRLRGTEAEDVIAFYRHHIGPWLTRFLATR